MLASLPDSFNTLVTALEASEDVPKMEVVTEKLLSAERKRREKNVSVKAMTTEGHGPRCQNCKKLGHIQRHCPERTKTDVKGEPKLLVTSHVLGVSEPAHHWIVDSEATCHICNSKELFEEFQPLRSHNKSLRVMVASWKQPELMLFHRD